MARFIAGAPFKSRPPLYCLASVCRTLLLVRHIPVPDVPNDGVIGLKGGVYSSSICACMSRIGVHRFNDLFPQSYKQTISQDHDSHTIIYKNTKDPLLILHSKLIPTYFHFLLPPTHSPTLVLTRTKPSLFISASLIKAVNPFYTCHICLLCKFSIIPSKIAVTNRL